MPLAIFLKKMKIVGNFFGKNVKFLAIFWQSNGNFPEGQVCIVNRKNNVSLCSHKSLYDCVLFKVLLLILLSVGSIVTRIACNKGAVLLHYLLNCDNGYTKLYCHFCYYCAIVAYKKTRRKILQRDRNCIKLMY